MISIGIDQTDPINQKKRSDAIRSIGSKKTIGREPIEKIF